MNFVAADPATPFARWTSRVAFFSAALLLSGLFLHRVFQMSTPIALNLVKASFALAALGFLLGIIASVQIWQTGGRGTSRVIIGMTIAAGLFAWPLVYLSVFRNLPPINDVTTNAGAPPPFVVLAKWREAPANGSRYAGQEFAALQAAAYPDVVPLNVDRPGAETFEIVAEALRRQGLTIVSEEAPSADDARSGQIEAVDRTPIIGFWDDVSVRVDGSGNRSRVDLRSASRFGVHDLGRNADRVRGLLKEIVARLEATVPTAGGGRLSRAKEEKEKELKQQKAGIRKSRVPRKSRDPAR